MVASAGWKSWVWLVRSFPELRTYNFYNIVQLLGQFSKERGHHMRFQDLNPSSRTRGRPLNLTDLPAEESSVDDAVSKFMERRLGSSVQTIDFEYEEIILFLIHSHSLSSQLDAVLLCCKHF